MDDKNDSIESIEKDLANIVRLDLNLEKWPNIFTPAQSRATAKVKTLERTKVLENGSIVVQKVEIDPSVRYGNLTTEDQKVLYGLLELWERAGRPEVLIFSLRELANILSRSWSSETGDALKKSLLRLSHTSFLWVNSYYDSVSEKTLELLDSFQIISNLCLARTLGQRRVNDGKCSCRFADVLYRNLVNNYTKPTFLDIVLKFKSGVAQLLYKYLELVMHKKTNYERNSKELFQELCLEGEEYKYKSGRKRILEIAIAEVNNTPIPSGILQIKIEQNKDKSDWKIVVRKYPHVSIVDEDEQSETEEQDPLPINKTPESTQTPKPSTKLETQIVLYFLEKFRLSRKAPLKNELTLAQTWIKTYNLDLEKGQALVNYAKTWAAATNFDIQNFAALTQYLDKALEKLAQIDTARQIASCTLCDSDGTIDCKEQGQTNSHVMTCTHSLESLQEYCNKHRAKIRLFDRKMLEPKS